MDFDWYYSELDIVAHRSYLRVIWQAIRTAVVPVDMTGVLWHHWQWKYFCQLSFPFFQNKFVENSETPWHKVKFCGFLICTLISENQSLEKSWSALKLRKISGPANLDFFSRSPPKKIQVTNWKKKSSCTGPEIFLWFEIVLNFSMPLFSEIKMQIKRPVIK